MNQERDCYGRLRDIAETYICAGQVVDALRILYTYRDLVDFELRECVGLIRRDFLITQQLWCKNRIREVKKVL